MRRSALALLLAGLLTLPAYADGPQTQSNLARVAPTPATSDNGNRVATTAWVNNYVNAGLPLANGAIWVGSVGNIATAVVPSNDCTISNAGAITCTKSSGAFTVNGNLTVGGTIIDNTNGITLNSPTGGAKGAGTINISADYYKNNVIIPETVSAPLSLSAGGVVSCPTCVLISGTGRGDAAYTILSTDRYVYTNAAFTLPRTWTLPAANSLAAGTTIWVQDAQGTVTSTNTLTISRAGADTINVSGTTVVMTGAGGGTQFTSDGVSNWGTAVQTVSTGGTGRQTLTSNGVLVGAGTNPITQLTAGTNGQLLLGATGAAPAFGTMSQDCTITAAGVIACTKTNNVAFGNYATLSAGQLSNSLGADVLLNNTANYFDGPSVAQGTSGTWFASGTVTIIDTVGAAFVYCKLWDGTTLISSTVAFVPGANQNQAAALSGFLASPAGNIRISCRDASLTTGKIQFNQSGNSKDSTISAFRIN